MISSPLLLLFPSLLIPAHPYTYTPLQPSHYRQSSQGNRGYLRQANQTSAAKALGLGKAQSQEMPTIGNIDIFLIACKHLLLPVTLDFLICLGYDIGSVGIISVWGNENEAAQTDDRQSRLKKRLFLLLLSGNADPTVCCKEVHFLTRAIK